MIKRIRDLNEALPGMIVIDFLYLVLGEIIILLAFNNPFLYAVGFFSGVVYAVFASFHLSDRIHRVVYGRANTTKTLVIGYLFRLLVMVLLFAVLYYFQLGDLLAALIGMFAMKVSAYLQPLYAKIIQNKRKGG